LAPLDLLLRDLTTTPSGLSDRDSARRLVQYGPNELQRQGGPTWLIDIVRQLVHPLALMLWVAAILAWVGGTSALGISEPGLAGDADPIPGRRLGR
jgi:magnesium-transporting ATPase (P-type)